MTISVYYDDAAVSREVSAGRHRELIGGLWDEIGTLQFNFMIARGLLPHHRLLDVGCGCLRGGVQFVRYLSPGNYFGTDVSQHLLDAGYTELVHAALDSKLPRSNLICGGGFNFTDVRSLDFALAQSLFTHLPADQIALCLHNLYPAMRRGGTFYASFFEAENDNCDSALTWADGITTYKDRDPFHYSFQAIESLANDWRVTRIGEWGHPRGQHMIEFCKTD